MTPLRLFLTLLGGILRPFVSGSHLFGVRPWSTGLWTFLGEYFRICRIQCFLAQQWVHVYVSLRRRGSCWWRCTSRCVPLRYADEGKYTPSITYSTKSMDLADPVSSGKHSGIFAFTAPVAELTVVSFTVPLHWFYHRCHCNYRDLVLFVGEIALSAAGVFAS